MDVELLRPHELSPAQLASWSALQERRGELASPFFRPEFTLAVADVRDDVLVAELADGSRVAGFFPFQRSRLGRGSPVGGGRSNCHGVVADPGLDLDARELVRRCGLRVFDFHQLPLSQGALRPFATSTETASHLELADGFEAYARGRRTEGWRIVDQTARRARLLERQVGTLRYEGAAAEPELLRLLMRWKSEQYRRTGMVDRFAIRWNVALLERLHAERSDAFTGALSVLRAGDEVAALAFGLRSRGSWHCWFPAFNRAFGRFSPGIVLMLMMARDAAERGIPVFDLGAGDALFKRRLRTGTYELAAGTVAASAPVAAAVRAHGRLVERTRGTALEPALQSARRFVRLTVARGRNV